MKNCINTAASKIQFSSPVTRPRNIVISGTNFWNPGDDFVRDGIIRILHEVFPGEVLNFLFYNFNADFFPQNKFAGIGNYVSQGDLEKYRDDIDAVVIAGLSAGDEIKDLYRWVVANNLAKKVWLVGAGYENNYVDQHIRHEPEATIFKNARVVTGRTAKTPEFFKAANIPYHHINCPAILSVREVKAVPAGKQLERIAFSIQLPSGEGLTNQTCAREQYELAVALMRELSQQYSVEVIAHHKTEYFHFLNLLHGENIPVIFSSFYQDLHQIYPRYDLVITTRLHSSLFANGHGIPGIILNDTDRHTHALDGFLHSIWVNNRESFDAAFERWKNADLAAIASEAAKFKTDLLARYVAALSPVAESTRKISVSEVSTPALPINFFTIVLNGQPFIQHHIEQFRQLPFKWRWHIVEGVAELNHDTGWSKATGGKVSAEFHRNGLSMDGTTEYLDELKREFPDNITIYRPPAGKFWDGKREMVNAPLANISEESLLWQVDADELWTASQIIRARALFLAHPEKSAAYFFCHYFVGPELVTTTRDTYGNNSNYEWLRVWRYQPGDRWLAHEPPRLCRGERDIAELNPFRHADTEAMGLVFQHYAYAIEAQVQFKESYYGYANAVAQWRVLQNEKQFPVKLAEYFAWVKDAALIDKAQTLGLRRLVPDKWLGIFETQKKSTVVTNLDDARRILFVRTDSIGDAVLASSMFEPLRRRYPKAQIAVLCQQHVADIFAACPFIDSVISFSRKKLEKDDVAREKILSEIAAFKPDVVLNSSRSRDKFSNDLTLAIPDAVHIAIEGDADNITESDRNEARAKYKFIIPLPVTRSTELQCHAEFLRGIDVESAALQPEVWTTQDDELLADGFFKQQEIDPLKTIALFPGAQHEVRVYNDYVSALKNSDDYRFLVFGDDSQNALAEKIKSEFSGRVVNLCGRTGLRETAALVRRCRLYIGAESAGAHIACAVGVPNVVLLGGGHFGRFMPYSPLTSAVTLPLDCFDCNWRCKYRRAHCVKDISAGVIAAAIRQTLEKSSSRPRIFLQAEKLWITGAALPAWKRPDALLPSQDVEFIEVENTVVGLEDVEIVGTGIANPIVSVVVSTYASERFMRACLENLSRQTIFDRIEIIVVDSGSPENERAIVEEFQKKFPNIRYVRTPRETLYAAWNRALKLARGRYFANANTDDSLRDDALEILATSLDQNTDCALSYADCAWTSKPNDTFPSAHIIRTVKYPDYAPVYTLFYCITGCLQFFRTESLRKLGGFDAALKCAGDYEATLKLVTARMNAVHVPEVLSLFYQNVGGLTQASNQAGIEHDAVMNYYREHLDIADIYKVDPKKPETIATAWAALAIYAERFYVPWEENHFEHFDYAFSCLCKAMDLDPSNEVACKTLIALNHKLGRLKSARKDLEKRWPTMRKWFKYFRFRTKMKRWFKIPMPNWLPLKPEVEGASIGRVYKPAKVSVSKSQSENQFIEEPLFEVSPVIGRLVKLFFQRGRLNEKRLKQGWKSYQEYMHFKLTRLSKKFFSSRKDYKNFKRFVLDRLANRQMGEVALLAQKEKREREEKFAASVKNLADIRVVEPKRILSFKHSGNAGDIIYSLPAIKAICNGHRANLYLHLDQPAVYVENNHPLGNVKLNTAMAGMLMPLLRCQSYFQEVEIYSGQKIDYDFDDFRFAPIQFDKGHISRWYFWMYGVSGDLTMPWLEIPQSNPPSDVIVLARSQRYRNLNLDFSFLQKMGEVHFIGVKKEYDEMHQVIPGLKHIQCADFLQMARVIKAARFFIGNQSFPYSVAEAMKVPRVLEVCPYCPNVMPDGPNGYEAFFQWNFEWVVNQLMQTTVSKA